MLYQPEFFQKLNCILTARTKPDSSMQPAINFMAHACALLGLPTLVLAVNNSIDFFTSKNFSSGGNSYFADPSECWVSLQLWLFPIESDTYTTPAQHRQFRSCMSRIYSLRVPGSDSFVSCTPTQDAPAAPFASTVKA